MSKVLPILQKGADLIGALFFLTIFLLFLLQIVARYIFQWPIGWPDEMITFLFVWVSFWGGAMMVPVERHITFDLIDNVLQRHVARWTRVVSLALTAGLFLAAVPITVDFIHFSHRQMTPVISIPLSFVYAPICLFLLTVALRLTGVAWREWSTPSETAQ